jgi:hypothetical protein
MINGLLGVVTSAVNRIKKPDSKEPQKSTYNHNDQRPKKSTTAALEYR